MEYNFEADLHTHTIASGHAYNTIREMARAAADKGLKALGITEHAPKLPGTCHRFYFDNLKIVSREMYGIRLFLGSEVNIMDSRGTLDMSDKLLNSMDIVIASLHIACTEPGTVEENTQAYLNVIKNPYVDIIGHPDDGRFPVDYQAVVQAAKDYGKVLELNNHSLDPAGCRENAWENDRKMLKLCKEYQVPIVVDSDAHFDELIGRFEYAVRLLNEMDFPKELVLNLSYELVCQYLER